MTASKSFYVSTALMAVFFVLAYNNTAVTYPDGPPNNRCGLYGSQPTCTVCHAANAGATNNLTIAGNPTAYALGQTYSLSISATGGSVYGFEIASVQATGGANAGTFVAPAGTEITNGTVLGNSIAFLKHNTLSSSGTWTINWTAPATNVGNVTFYLATLSGNNNNSSSGDKTQTRTLTLNAPNGCTTLAVNITGNNSICQGQSTTFMANGGNTYVWSNGSGSSSTTASTAGTYTVTATDSNACTGTASVTLTILPNPVATTSSTNALCNGGFGTIGLSVTGGSSPYVYAWSNGQTTQNPSNVVAGTYTVTVTSSNSCSSIASAIITQPSALIISTNTSNTCNGTAIGTAAVLANGGTAAYTYLWSTSATTANISNLAAGTYTVTVTDSNACTAIANAPINSVAVPSPSISQSGSTCANGVGMYAVTNPGVSGTQYNWVVTGGTITAGQGTANITVQWGNGGEGTVHVDQTNP